MNEGYDRLPARCRQDRIVDTDDAAKCRREHFTAVECEPLSIQPAAFSAVRGSAWPPSVATRAISRWKSTRTSRTRNGNVRPAGPSFENMKSPWTRQILA